MLLPVFASEPHDLNIGLFSTVFRVTFTDCVTVHAPSKGVDM